MTSVDALPEFRRRRAVVEIDQLPNCRHRPQIQRHPARVRPPIRRTDLLPGNRPAWWCRQIPCKVQRAPDFATPVTTGRLSDFASGSTVFHTAGTVCQRPPLPGLFCRCLTAPLMRRSFSVVSNDHRSPTTGCASSSAASRCAISAICASMRSSCVVNYQSRSRRPLYCTPTDHRCPCRASVPLQSSRGSTDTPRHNGIARPPGQFTPIYDSAGDAWDVWFLVAIGSAVPSRYPISHSAPIRVRAARSVLGVTIWRNCSLAQLPPRALPPRQIPLSLSAWSPHLPHRIIEST